MDIIDLAAPAQLIAIIGLFTYLAIAFYQVRVERRVYRLMTTEAPEVDDSDVRYGHQYKDQASIGGATQWEALSWEDKMHFQRLEHRLNWSAAVTGGVVMISAVIWGYAEVFLGWEEGLGTAWLVVVFINFFAGLAYLLYNYWLRWRWGRGRHFRASRRR